MQEQTDEGDQVVEIYQPVKAYGNYCFQGEDVEKGVLLFEKGTQIRHMHVGIMASQGIIIMQEQTDEGDQVVEIYQPVKAYGNYCFQGEDVEKGVLLFEKGTQIRHMHVGIMASQGIEDVQVYSVPRIGVMATGDELMPVGCALMPGKIYDSNGPLLSARVMELGMEAVRMDSFGDDTERLADAVMESLGQCDALITSGGVSVGSGIACPLWLNIWALRCCFMELMQNQAPPSW